MKDKFKIQNFLKLYKQDKPKEMHSQVQEKNYENKR